MLELLDLESTFKAVLVVLVLLGSSWIFLDLLGVVAVAVAVVVDDDDDDDLFWFLFPTVL